VLIVRLPKNKLIGQVLNRLVEVLLFAGGDKLWMEFKTINFLRLGSVIECRSKALAGSDLQLAKSGQAAHVRRGIRAKGNNRVYLEPASKKPLSKIEVQKNISSREIKFGII